MNTIRIERINNMLQQEISYVVANEVKDKNVKFVTITAVVTTNDLSFAKVYFTTLNNKEETLHALNKASHFIRSSLFDRVEIRHIPELEFVYDNSIEYGQTIENIIEKIHDQE